jgi:hypothetical protein
MKFNLMLSAALVFTLMSCKNDTKQTKTETPTAQTVETKPNFKNKAHKLVYQMTQKVGDYSKLANKKDVIYKYTYTLPDGKQNISIEKYMFNGELSYGSYEKHERTLPNLEGHIEQGYNGSEFWLKHNGQLIEDAKMLKGAAFSRPTNFYWFTMMQKLLDPGLNYEYIKEQTINDKLYDVVKVSFESNDGKPKDIYQLYINKDTKIVDQFLFTVMDFGKSEPKLMQMEYESIDGLLMPTKRKYKSSNWDAEVTDAPWIQATWNAIKFNNGLTKEDFNK